MNPQDQSKNPAKSFLFLNMGLGARFAVFSVADRESAARDRQFWVGFKAVGHWWFLLPRSEPFGHWLGDFARFNRDHTDPIGFGRCSSHTHLAACVLLTPC